jgi:hypothetical protein
MSDTLKEFLRLGYFESAINYCKEKIEKGNTEDRVYYKGELSFISEIYARFIENQPGETYLPVVDRATNKARLLKICVDFTPRNMIQYDDWKSEVEPIVRFVLKKITDNSPLPTLVYDLRFDNIYCGIRSNSYFDEKFEIVGRSYILPLVMAVLSLIINKKIPENICFSGDIEFRAGQYNLKSVEGIKEKSELLTAEFKNIDNFIYPDYNRSDLFELTNRLFDNDIENIIESKVIDGYFQLLKKNAYSVEGTHNLITLDNKKDKLDSEDFLKIADFLSKHKGFFKDDGKGIILDGRAPIAVYSFIMAHTEIVNTLKSFIAINYPPSSSPADDFDKTAIIVKTGHMSRNYKPGQFIFYKT